MEVRIKFSAAMLGKDKPNIENFFYYGNRPIKIILDDVAKELVERTGNDYFSPKDKLEIEIVYD